MLASMPVADAHPLLCVEIIILQTYWYITGTVRNYFSTCSGLLINHCKWDKMIRQLTDKLDN
jgi:hypothetical protein